MSNNSFLEVFAKSPLKPLEEHIDTVHLCSQGLIPFFDAVFRCDWQEAAKQQKDIADLERKADDLKRELRVNLPAGIFMPIQRNDLLELLSKQDKIANRARDIAGRVLGRELEVPATLQPQFMAYVARCVDATQQAKNVTNELDELLETGFKGREVKVVEHMIEELDRIEDDTDKLQVQLRKDLRAIETQLNPVDVIFLYNIIDWIGDLADISQRVGSRLELMLAS
ncbi:TIGR00153 family protein [Aliiglaciecola sp. CAU 1673]|uniref:TIGR00153 family protein n=1 Tax=Aliiglaciecola sp. CAU 1673 TaxID=3032595 RepID=UPI0023DA1640|nr:TIGR00153 family protein [Aliiglaciecola sp. CAU 1673]MDF2176971.1 TIGR00153 family protein [Aliiglaciecola sp. CAU 1673]